MTISMKMMLAKIIKLTRPNLRRSKCKNFLLLIRMKNGMYHLSCIVLYCLNQPVCFSLVSTSVSTSLESIIRFKIGSSDV